MAVRDVLLYPHPALKATAEPAVVERDAQGFSEAESAARDLLETMRDFGHCVGLDGYRGGAADVGGQVGDAETALA
ncbi:MAG: hypothetical protein M3N56_13870, partial [Actinomycetota bacterium]|nr:hypothetical protein [Actinomycetota bacterium]